MRRPSDFTSTLRRGPGTARVGLGAVVVHVRTAEEPMRAGASEGPARVGFVVSRAVGPAVVRNRVKRRLRHAMRPLLRRLPAGTRIVVRAQPAAAGASWDRLTADLEAALTRALARSATPVPVTSRGSASPRRGGGSPPLPERELE
jgi:ribonuclease P protein component